MKVAIGSDHTGIDYKYLIINYLIKKGHRIKDFGYSNYGEKVDYPDFIHPTAESVEKGEADFGIIICGSGNGAAMTANKYQKIRAALVWKKEIAFLAKRHNNANILSLPARFVDKKEVLEIVEMFIQTDFEGGRHKIRIEKIPIK
ncbi:ribose 5-phosphate isomerase B [Blattabacterium sp. (Mastotermes darwiniensis) str. MADAR]|uniref:RpiB/LacA/LacB family sugar-phosphate isomerase n=1 Tax=Blattabacterium sp. (Mastotermes darwiniensis) TaxID=39768 RepID=UPI000231DE3C|nr:RpiB/LacA/LacB family sugar-phosphate isomerase [Blattabacterium sp. (Mastotermes darwiniensis)]AER40624.1 ribose 5-phosphate isomerase B [Blattabacterium sp. (Mastotermes darwiniensis) str. MADAR]